MMLPHTQPAPHAMTQTAFDLPYVFVAHLGNCLSPFLMFSSLNVRKLAPQLAVFPDIFRHHRPTW